MRTPPAGTDPIPVRIPSGATLLDADLAVPPSARGIVVFAHGSGSSRRSRRNRAVATGLQRAAFATLLLDLLTSEEEEEDQRTRALRFDIPRLAGRVADAVDWVHAEPRLAALPIGLFGASTGAAAAIIAAAERPDVARAVVSRGGRPDLAGDALGRLRTPALLIVGGDDATVVALNEEAAAAMRAEHEIAIVPGAGHLFEEPGRMEQVETLARDWFARWLVA